MSLYDRQMVSHASAAIGDLLGFWEAISKGWKNHQSVCARWRRGTVCQLMALVVRRSSRHGGLPLAIRLPHR
ncbi:hypothetical protein KCP76_23145 [Salmonella enterica subsp. enterica serovar Weltevreden]|nr:hypothetical protein KCP76_23145 [Salmonella enterica subsp. enterica serovar Weltevreden]